MLMGAYDEAKYERRERMTSQVKSGTDDDWRTYHGSVEYDSGDSIDTLLEQFKRMKSDN